MKKEAKRRIKLIEYLEQLDESKFDISAWVTTHEVTIDRMKHQLKHGCGTAACVVGHLPIVFPRHFKYDHIPGLGKEYFVSQDGLRHEYFGLSDAEFSKIIYEQSYPCKPTLTMVIQRLKDAHRDQMLED